MTTIKGYANYGVLRHEKQTIFTVAGKNEYATTSEEIELEIPDGWEVSKNDFGMLLITSPDGITYGADEIVSSWGDNPVLKWYDLDGSSHRIKLNWKVA